MNDLYFINNKRIMKKVEKHENCKRSAITRYPGVLTDWGGRWISKEIRNHITVGNIVRIPI